MHLSSMQISPIDCAILVLYLVGITLFGARFRRGQQNSSRLFSGRPQLAVVGDHVFHRRHRDLHAYDHQHTRNRLRRKSWNFCNWSSVIWLLG